MHGKVERRQKAAHLEDDCGPEKHIDDASIAPAPNGMRSRPNDKAGPVSADDAHEPL
jgi:hypothetical protein